MDLIRRVESLLKTVSAADPNQYPTFQTGEIFNVLLAEAKKAKPKDPVLAALQKLESWAGPPVGAGASAVKAPKRTGADCGTLAAALRQISLALRGA